MINYSFDYIDYPQRFNRIVNDNLRRIMNIPMEKLNEWLNSKEVQYILEYNHTKLINTQIPEQIDYIDKQIHG